MLSVCRPLILFFVLCASANSWAVTPGQVDDFQDGMTQAWAWGRPSAGGPEIVDDGSGSGDLYLQNESFGGSDAPGSRMIIINRDQWTGDFLASGISSIRMDAINLGPNFAYQDMNLRLAFFSETALQGGGRVSTSMGFPLIRDAGWQTVEFDLSDLTAIADSDISEVMSSVSEMRILSSTDPAFTGDRFSARLGLDNVTAVPEPGSFLLLLVGIVLGIKSCRINSRRS